VDREQFRSLPLGEVARLVRSAGPKTCVFPINGTRRWFVLEYPDLQSSDTATEFLQVIAKRHIELYRLLFDHGLDTLLTPAFGPDLLSRGEAYVAMAAEGLAWLATNPDFLDFYKTYGVRVRFYGDYGRHLAPTPYAHLLDLFEDVTARTASNDRHRLFFGLFAHDAAETVAAVAIQHFVEEGQLPDKRRLVELYYGEYVGPADIFIGFDKFCVFDMPLLGTGNEDLYFTVSPSVCLGELQLRDILYDHLYARRGGEPDCAALEPQDRAWMRAFYQANQECILGVGARQGQKGFWYPLPQVKLPASPE
jgi:tuberculosinol/isotuberculosinol synthase